MGMIDLGQFGFRTPQVPAGGGAVPGAFVSGDGFNSVGRAIQETGLTLMRRQEERNREEREKADRLTATSRLMAYEVDSETVVDDVLSRLRRQEIDSDKAHSEIVSALEKKQQDLLDGVTDDVKKSLTIGFLGPTRRAIVGAGDKIEAHYRGQQRGAILAAEGALERLGMSDPALAVSQHGALLDNAGGILAPEEAEAKRQGFKERTWFAFFQRATLAAEDSIKSLDTVKQAIGKSSDLDPNKATMLLDRVDAARDRLIARAQAGQQKRLVAIEKAINAQEDVILRGFPSSPEALRQIANAAKGTELAADAERLAKMSTFMTKFVNASPVAMEAELARVDQELAKPGAVVTKDALEIRDKLSTLLTNTRKQLAEDPVRYAVARGIIPAERIDFKSPRNVRERVNAAVTLNREFGSPMRILLPEEATAIAGVMKKATPDEKRDFYRTLERTINDPGVYAGVMAQLAGDSPVMALAGMVASRPDVKIRGGWFASDRTYTARKVSDLMLAGDVLLNPGPDAKGKVMAMPQETILNGEFSATYDGVFAGAPQARNAAYQAARAVYAALSAEAGDYSGQIDSGRWKTAAHLATGGVVRYNGAPVLPLYGLDEAQFTDRAAHAIRSAAQAGTLPGSLDQLLRAPLENAGDGVFRMRRGSGYWLGTNGQPFKLDLHRVQRGTGASGSIPGKGQRSGTSGSW